MFLTKTLYATFNSSLISLSFSTNLFSGLLNKLKTRSSHFLVPSNALGFQGKIPLIGPMNAPYTLNASLPCDCAISVGVIVFPQRFDIFLPSGARITP
jgi:hypothetical protein